MRARSSETITVIRAAVNLLRRLSPVSFISHAKVICFAVIYAAVSMAALACMYTIYL